MSCIIFQTQLNVSNITMQKQLKYTENCKSKSKLIKNRMFQHLDINKVSLTPLHSYYTTVYSTSSSKQ